MVVDTSVILAIFFAQNHARWATQQLNLHQAALSMSTVNLTETLIHIRDRQPQDYLQLEERLLGSGIRFVPPDTNQAQIAAAARLRYPLNLGDCFAYALARSEGLAIITLDSDFKHVDCPIIHPTL